MKKRMEHMDWWEQKMGHHTDGMGGGRGRIEEKRDGKRNEIVLRIRRLWEEMKHQRGFGHPSQTDTPSYVEQCQN